MKPNPTRIRQQITEQIITALEKGIRPWVRPWRPDANTGRPTSVASGKPFQGINSLLLELRRQRLGLRSQWWGTINQWQEIGAKVQAPSSHATLAEWGCRVVSHQPITRAVQRARAFGEEQEKALAPLRTMTVFNADQVDGTDHFKAAEESSPGPWWPNFTPAQRLLIACGAEIRSGGDEAFYSAPEPEGTWPYHKGGDFIQLPPRHWFDHPGHFFWTAFHELAHWSQVRLGWDRETNGDYSMGELIAEIGSCFTCAELEIPGREGIESSVSCMKQWLEAMKADSSFIFRASSQASRVTDFLMGFVRGKE